MVLSKRSKEKSNILTVGQVVGVHGIKGELKVALFYPDINFENIKKVQLSERTFFVESYRFHKKKLLLKLQEVTDRTTAESLVKQKLFVAKEFLGDLVLEKANIFDKEVYDKDNNALGVVEAVIETPAHDVLVVKNKNNQEIMIPWVDKFVLEIRDDKIIVNLTDLAEA